MDPPVSVPIAPKCRARGQGHARTYAAAARESLEVPGRARRWFAAAAGEFVAARLSDDDGAGRVQLLDYRRVVVRVSKPASTLEPTSVKMPLV